MRAVHLLRRAVIPTEDADLWLLLVARGRFPHLPFHAEQIKSREASSDAHLPLLGGGQQPPCALVLEGAQDGEALFQVQDGGGRGAAAGVQVSTAVAFAAGRDYARARRAVVQAQSGFQGLRDGVGTLGDAVLVVLGDQRGEAEIVIPKIEGVIVGGAPAQVVVVQKIHVSSLSQNASLRVKQMRYAYIPSRFFLSALRDRKCAEVQCVSWVCASEEQASGYKAPGEAGGGRGSLSNQVSEQQIHSVFSSCMTSDCSLQWNDTRHSFVMAK